MATYYYILHILFNYVFYIRSSDLNTKPNTTNKSHDQYFYRTLKPVECLHNYILHDNMTNTIGTPKLATHIGIRNKYATTTTKNPLPFSAPIIPSIANRSAQLASVVRSSSCTRPSIGPAGFARCSAAFRRPVAAAPFRWCPIRRDPTTSA